MSKSPVEDLTIASLARCDLFRDAGEALLASMAAELIQRNWRQGEVLFLAGDESDGFYIVLEGSIRLGLEKQDGGELTLRDASAGDLFGEMGALDGGARSASARVTTAKARTAFLSTARLQTLLQNNPAFLLQITHKLCRRLRETTDQLEGIALYPLRQRLARYILAKGDERGHARADGKRSVSIAMSQGSIATMLGASRPKLNGALQELERAGIVSRSGALYLYDNDKLRSEAEGGNSAH